MSGGESEVSGGKGRPVQRRAARGSQVAKPKRRSFTAERRQQFLDHFAASCNAAAAAQAVGVSENCVYAWRKKDSAFCAGWSEALAQGYARLETELLLASSRALNPQADGQAAARVGAMDAKTALAVLEAYRRSGGRAPGAVWPHPYDVEAVRARLETKLRILGVDVGAESATAKGEDEEEAPSPAKAREELSDPSTAARSSSPGNPGEEI